ncbi:hypothetical protein ACJJTC_012078 [Scirpophaga incertulas]
MNLFAESVVQSCEWDRLIRECGRGFAGGLSACVEPLIVGNDAPAARLLPPPPSPRRRAVPGVAQPEPSPTTHWSRQGIKPGRGQFTVRQSPHRWWLDASASWASRWPSTKRGLSCSEHFATGSRGVRVEGVHIKVDAYLKYLGLNHFIEKC